MTYPLIIHTWNPETLTYSEDRRLDMEPITNPGGVVERPGAKLTGLALNHHTLRRTNINGIEVGPEGVILFIAKDS